MSRSSGESSQSGTDGTSGFGVPLSREEQWDVLCEHLTALKGSMNTSALMSYLAQRHLLTLNESEILTNPLHTSEEKANKVLLWIPQKGPHALRKFIECLRDSAGDQGAGHHSELADHLQDSLCKFVDERKKKSCAMGKFWTTITLCFLVAVAAVLAQVWFSYMYTVVIYPSRSLPISTEVFLGREKEMQHLMKLLDFHSSDIRIVTIDGSPGFGKSTLAIHIGDVVKDRGGVQVHYIDLYEISTVTTLKEDMTLTLDFQSRTPSRDPLLLWARELKMNTLLILDNCDGILHSQKDMFQMFVKNLIKQSTFIRVILTAKHVTSFLGQFQNFTLNELSIEAAADVLQELSPSLNSTAAMMIANFVGNVPLALQVAGSLLKVTDPDSIISELSRDPIPLLSPERLQLSERVNTTLNASYHYLPQEFQFCGRILANFPGSFDKKAAHYVLTNVSIELSVAVEPLQCLSILQQRSLLNYDHQRHRYRFHQLIKEFFLHVQHDTKEKEVFLLGFFFHYMNSYLNMSVNLLRDLWPPSASKSMTQQYLRSLDFERSNFDLLFSMNFTGLVSDHTETIYSSAEHTFDAAKEALLDDITLKDIFTEATLHLTFSIRQNWILEVSTRELLLVMYDVEFRSIASLVGNSTYFEVYVKLLLSISKSLRTLYGYTYALRILELRHSRVAELYSYASTNNNNASTENFIAYYSALAHNYMLSNKYAKFVDCWQEVLRLRKTLDECRHRRCSSLHLGLAFFGIGNYEQAIKYLEPRIQSRRLSINTKARIFTIVYVSHIRMGNVTASKALLNQEKIFLSIDWDFRIGDGGSPELVSTGLGFPRPVDKLVMAKLDEFANARVGSSLSWQLWWNTVVTNKTYRAFIIVGSFYRSLNVRGAKKSGRALRLLGFLYCKCREELHFVPNTFTVHKSIFKSMRLSLGHSDGAHYYTYVQTYTCQATILSVFTKNLLYLNTLMND